MAIHAETKGKKINQQNIKKLALKTMRHSSAAMNIMKLAPKIAQTSIGFVRNNMTMKSELIQLHDCLGWTEFSPQLFCPPPPKKKNTLKAYHRALREQCHNGTFSGATVFSGWRSAPRAGGGSTAGGLDGDSNSGSAAPEFSDTGRRDSSWAAANRGRGEGSPAAWFAGLRVCERERREERGGGAICGCARDLREEEIGARGERGGGTWRYEGRWQGLYIPARFLTSFVLVPNFNFDQIYCMIFEFVWKHSKSQSNRALSKRRKTAKIDRLSLAL